MLVLRVCVVIVMVVLPLHLGTVVRPITDLLQVVRVGAALIASLDFGLVEFTPTHLLLVVSSQSAIMRSFSIWRVHVAICAELSRL